MTQQGVEKNREAEFLKNKASELIAQSAEAVVPSQL